MFKSKSTITMPRTRTLYKAFVLLLLLPSLWWIFVLMSSSSSAGVDGSGVTRLGDVPPHAISTKVDHPSPPGGNGGGGGGAEATNPPPPSLLCEVPYLDPFEDSMKSLFEKPEPMVCDDVPWVSLSGSKLTVDRTKCLKVDISEVLHDYDFAKKKESFKLVEAVSFDAADVQAKSIPFEYIHIHCSKPHPSLPETPPLPDIFHSQLVADPVVIREQVAKLNAQKQKNPTAPSPPNILMLGFDSTSKASAQRFFPKVLKFFDELAQEGTGGAGSGVTVELKGLTIVADGTTGNLGGLLLGMDEVDLPESRRKLPDAISVDGWPWIWKELHEQGYVSVYAEDQPRFQAFGYRLLGFEKPPTHHYMTPYWLSTKDRQWACLQDKWHYERQFDIVRDMFREYKESGVPLFGFIFSKMAHDGITRLAYSEETTLAFLKELKAEGYLDNTIIYFFGDHGMRYGPLRNTVQGKMEERLPMSHIHIPAPIATKYPKLMENLKLNENRLSTPYDVHATLKHLLSLPQEPTGLKKYQQSLLNLIPHTRMCPEANVDTQWCTCSKWEKRGTTDPEVVLGVGSILDYLNALLEKDGNGQCERITAARVISVEEEKISDAVLQFQYSKDADGRDAGFAPPGSAVERRHYQVRLSITPGGGILEGEFFSVWSEDPYLKAAEELRKTKEGKNHNQYAVADSLVVDSAPRIYKSGTQFSRIDAYGDHQCVIPPHLRKYCICK